MAKVSKSIRRRVRSQSRDAFTRKMTWAVKPGDLVEDKSGNIGMALVIQSNSCFMLSPTGQKWVRLSHLIKVSEDV